MYFMLDMFVCDEDLVSIIFIVFNFFNGMVYFYFYVDFFFKMINNVFFFYFILLFSLIVICGKELIEFF